MPDTAEVPLIYRTIFESGVVLKESIDSHLVQWEASDAANLRDESVPDQLSLRINDLRDRLHRWFGVVSVNVVPYTPYDRRYVTALFRQANAAVAGKTFYQEYRPPSINPNHMFARMISQSPQFNVEMDVAIKNARADAAAVMDEAIRLDRTAQVPSATVAATALTQVIPNSAFIIMWMDPARPELVDVHEAAKEAFCRFRDQGYASR